MAWPTVTPAQVAALSPAKRARLAHLLTPRMASGFCPHQPFPKQIAALLLPHREILYGGAAGGGKSDWLLMGALQYVDVPGYAALLLRRTFAQLEKANGLVARAKAWLSATPAVWNGANMRWTFPSGATLEFGHLQHEDDKHNYQSAEYAYIGFDELTQFAESQYRYLFSRLRRLKGSAVPLRIRAASNPGGEGHDWVRARFALPEGRPDRPFVPATMADNAFLDREDYAASLANLDPVTRRQLEDGDWTARSVGALFRREWFSSIVDALPAGAPGVRYWDLAATEPNAEATDPDWTASCRMHRGSDGALYIADVRRLRARPGERDKAIRAVAELDGRGLPIVIEQEPGASGKSQVEYLVRDLLSGWTVSGDRKTGDKFTRAGPLASQAQIGNVRLLRGTWISAFLDELEAFPDGSHDDQVDAASGAFATLSSRPRQAVGVRF